MSYRDDLAAAQARADAAERKAAALQRQLDGAKPAPRPIPERLRIEEAGGSLTISWRWFRAPMHLFLLFWCALWNGILLAGISQADSLAAVPWVVFPHGAIGVAMTYWLAMGLVNRAFVTAAPGVLRTYHRPLPWRSKELRVADIRQLYVRSSGREKHPGGSTALWKVCALLDRDRETTLVDNLDDYDVALSIEQRLEKHLGIVDEPVAPEQPKSVANEAAKQ